MGVTKGRWVGIRTQRGAVKLTVPFISSGGETSGWGGAGSSADGVPSMAHMFHEEMATRRGDVGGKRRGGVAAAL
jgi:hypothetical protein